MAETFKILGQANPNATQNTDVYTVPASTETIVSKIIVCNQASTAGTARVAIRDAAIAAKHYIMYDTTVPANDSIEIEGGITMDASDAVTVYVSTANFSVSVFGSEITA